MIVTYKYKLYQAKQNKHLKRDISKAGYIYNHMIALHKRYYSLYGKSLNVYALNRHITKLKKRKGYEYLKQLGSQAVQDIAFRIDKGYKLFFRNLKHNIRTSPPSFRKVKKYRSFTLTQAGWSLNGNVLRIGQRLYKFHYSRALPKDGKIKTVTIKRNALGELFVCFSIDTTVIKDRIMTGKSAGFDFGLKTFLTVSDGTEIHSPLFMKRSKNKLASLQRAKDKACIGSARHRTLTRQIASLHEHIASQRRDWFFKLAHELTDKYDNLFFEDLNLKGMVRLWGRKVTDLAFSTFIEILKYVASTKGKFIGFVDRFFPSSKLCGACGVINDSLTLKDRHWRCACGKLHDRDKNAANNILHDGMSLCLSEAV